METQVDEIAAGIFRLSTFTDQVAGGFTFNQFLVKGEEALLFHTGPRQMFPLVSAAVAKILPLDRLRYVSFGHWEADESGALNLWLEAAPTAEVAVGALGTMLSGMDQADPSAPSRRWPTAKSSIWAASRSGGSTRRTSPTAGTPG